MGILYACFNGALSTLLVSMIYHSDWPWDGAVTGWFARAEEFMRDIPMEICYQIYPVGKGSSQRVSHFPLDPWILSGFIMFIPALPMDQSLQPGAAPEVCCHGAGWEIAAWWNMFDVKKKICHSPGDWSQQQKRKIWWAMGLGMGQISITSAETVCLFLRVLHIECLFLCGSHIRPSPHDLKPTTSSF